MSFQIDFVCFFSHKAAKTVTKPRCIFWFVYLSLSLNTLCAKHKTDNSYLITLATPEKHAKVWGEKKHMLFSLCITPPDAFLNIEQENAVGKMYLVGACIYTSAQ